MLLVNKKYRQLYAILFVLICIADTARWNSLVGHYFSDSIFFVLHALTLAFFLKYSKNEQKSFAHYDYLVIKYYLMYALFSIARGLFFEADNYWEYKALMNNSFTLMAPICIYFFCRPHNLKYTLNLWVKYMIPLFLIFVFTISKDAVGYYLAPAMTLALFFPCLSKKWRIIIGLCIVCSITFFLGARAIIMKNLTVVMLVLFFYVWNVSSRFMKWFRYILVFTPLILLALGFCGIFNIFSIADGAEGRYEVTSVTGKSKEDLSADTRTGIYEDQWQSSVKNKAVLWGVSPARGYECSYAEAVVEIIKQAGNMKGVTNMRFERSGCEVGILNIFCWEGLIGVILFSLLFLRASYLAVCRSNNLYIKTMGLFCAFRWLLSFIEDYYTFDLKGIALWWIVAICLSREFRAMSNSEIKKWASEIFIQK